MSTNIFYKNKATGVVYVYESTAYWDKEKQQGRAKRKCIGHIDPVTGDIVPNRPKKPSNLAVRNENRRTFYGATYLFDAIGDKIGVPHDLRQCFPHTWREILSIAYFLILEDKNPLSRFSKFAATHKHPYEEDIPSQRSSELFASIGEEERMEFFRLQGARRVEREYLAYDITTISSYSKCLRQVQFGHNKEHDPLAQLNLALLFGEESGLPFYYRQLPGNIPDSKTVKNLLSDMAFFGYTKIHAVLDRGFYSEENINGLYQQHIKFLLGARLSLAFVKRELAQCREQIRAFGNYNAQHDLYGCRRDIEWSYTQKRPYKGDVLQEKRRMYLFFYYNGQKATDDERDFTIRMQRYYQELESGNRVAEHERSYAKYFTVRNTPKRGITVTPIQEAMDDAKKNFGYFALIGNDTMDAVRAIEIYRNKDLVEKAFENIKDRLNCRRLAVSSELSLNGKIFVEFIALIYLSYIHQRMQAADLYAKATMQEVLDKLDTIECYERPGHRLRWGEMTLEQRGLFEKLGVVLPA